MIRLERVTSIVYGHGVDGKAGECGNDAHKLIQRLGYLSQLRRTQQLFDLLDLAAAE